MEVGQKPSRPLEKVSKVQILSILDELADKSWGFARFHARAVRMEPESSWASTGPGNLAKSCVIRM
jgi:hypothetical protein